MFSTNLARSPVIFGLGPLSDLLAATRIPKADLICTAERARGYKPDGTLFRYLIAHAGVGVPEILHSGQSQHTDMVGGKPLGPYQ